METSACQDEDFCVLQIGHDGPCSEVLSPDTFRLVVGSTSGGAVVSTEDAGEYLGAVKEVVFERFI